MGLKWSRKHVDYITSSTSHPLKCTSCHLYMQESPLLGMIEKDYTSPFNLSISPDDKFLYVVGQEDNSLSTMDLSNRQVVGRLQFGSHLHSIALDSHGKYGYVSSQWTNHVYKIDVSKGQLVDSIKVGAGPSGLIIDKESAFLYVVNTFSNDLSVVNLSTLTEEKRLSVGNSPTGINMSPDGNKVLVLSRKTLSTAFREPPKVELTIVNTALRRVEDRKEVINAHIMENISVSPEGDIALFTLVRPKNLVPAMQIENGWMINFGIGILDMNSGEIHQLLLDEPNAFYADPFDVEFSPDGKMAIVSHSGADYLSVLDVEKIRTIIDRINKGEINDAENNLLLSHEFVTKRIQTGSAPKGIAFTSNGNELFYAEYLTDNIGVLNLSSGKIGEKIPLNDIDQTAFLRRGQQLFYSADHTFQRQYSCYTCHPDGHEDGLTYDMALIPGKDITNVQTLRELPNTAPFKWNGKNVSVYMQCGMRFSKFVTRTESFSPDDLDAVVGYILTQLKHPPNIYLNKDGQLTEAQKRGKVIFERTKTNDGRIIPVENRCTTCHPAPNYTDRRNTDVGTLASHDSPITFDSPNLNNVYESAPYLHDGRAMTLEEIWTKNNDYDQHGVANDLTKNQLNDMIEYLKSLGSARYYK